MTTAKGGLQLRLDLVLVDISVESRTLPKIMIAADEVGYQRGPMAAHGPDLVKKVFLQIPIDVYVHSKAFFTRGGGLRPPPLLA